MLLGIDTLIKIVERPSSKRLSTMAIGGSADVE
jgi:hypothetical protein